MKRGYSSRLVREQILRARKFKRDELLNRETRQSLTDTQPKLIFNVTYHPKLAKTKTIMERIHVILAFKRI